MKATSELIKVIDIKENAYILENGGVRRVIEVPGINFTLASSKEQDLIIGAFKNFLDGLDFKIQILLLSRYANISRYLDFIKQKEEQESEPLIKFQLREYHNFLKEYVETHHVMQKIFYIIVPYDSPAVEAGFQIPVLDFFKKKTKPAPEDLKTKLSQLDIRTSYIIEGLASVGISAKILDEKGLLALLFDLINPGVYWQTLPNEIFEALSSISNNA